jgi:hypothetical protein
MTRSNEEDRDFVPMDITTASGRPSTASVAGLTHNSRPQSYTRPVCEYTPRAREVHRGRVRHQAGATGVAPPSIA